MALGEPHKKVEHRLTADEIFISGGKITIIPGARIDLGGHPTDFKYSDSEARDASGRWTVGGGSGKKPNEVSEARLQGRLIMHEQAKKHFVDKMKSKVSDRMKRIYTKTVDEALRGYSSKALLLAMQHVSKIKIVNEAAIDKAMNDTLGGTFGAYYSPWRNMIALSDENIDPRVIAHEAAHAVDYGDEFSDMKEWRLIYRDEFENKKAKALGSYSRTNRVEAFAKAMEHTTNAEDYKTLKRKCPRAHAFLVKNDLIARWES